MLGVDFEFETFREWVVGHEGQEFELVEFDGLQGEEGERAWFALECVLRRVEIRGLSREFFLASTAGAKAGQHPQ